MTITARSIRRRFLTVGLATAVVLGGGACSTKTHDIASKKSTAPTTTLLAEGSGSGSGGVDQVSSDSTGASTGKSAAEKSTAGGFAGSSGVGREAAARSGGAAGGSAGSSGIGRDTGSRSDGGSAPTPGGTTPGTPSTPSVDPDPVRSPTPGTPVIRSFHAPASVTCLAGTARVTISWDVTGADRIVIRRDRHIIDITDTFHGTLTSDFACGSDHVYNLTAEGPGGNAVTQRTVRSARPPIVVDPGRIGDLPIPPSTLPTPPTPQPVIPPRPVVPPRPIPGL